jgi:hypothetical protein
MVTITEGPDLELSPEEAKSFLAAVFEIQPSCISRAQYAINVEKDEVSPQMVCGPTIMLWGAPGIGKSSIIREAAEKAGIDTTKNLMDIRLATLEPVDLRGVPSVELGRTRYNPPELFPIGKNEVEDAKIRLARNKLEQVIKYKYEDILKKADQQTRGVILFDELPSAEPEIQIAAYEIILDRRIGQYEVPDTWSIVAAGNRESEAPQAAHNLPVPLANRMLHIGVRTTPEDWAGWAQSYRIDPLIQVFGRQELQQRPGELQNGRGFGAGENSPEYQIPAFLSPRSLEWLDYVNKLVSQYGIVDKINPTTDDRRNQIETALYRSAVGRKEGISFKYWKGTKDFTLTGDEIYNNPSDTERYFRIITSKDVATLTDGDIEQLARIKAKVSGQSIDETIRLYKSKFKDSMKEFLVGPITTVYYPNLLLELELANRITNGTANKEQFLAAAKAIAASSGKLPLGIVEGIAHRLTKATPRTKLVDTVKYTSDWMKIIDDARKGR